MLSNTHALNNETLSNALFRVIADGEDFRNAPYFDTDVSKELTDDETIKLHSRTR